MARKQELREKVISDRTWGRRSFNLTRLISPPCRGLEFKCSDIISSQVHIFLFPFSFLYSLFLPLFDLTALTARGGFSETWVHTYSTTASLSFLLRVYPALLARVTSCTVIPSNTFIFILFPIPSLWVEFNTYYSSCRMSMRQAGFRLISYLNASTYVLMPIVYFTTWWRGLVTGMGSLLSLAFLFEGSEERAETSRRAGGLKFWTSVSLSFFCLSCPCCCAL